MGIPKTIDNDLNGTDLTIGFFTAVTTAVEALDKLHTTAESHHRVMIVEVMGRNAGWIALFAGLGGDADVILIPEIPYELKKVAAFLKDLHHSKKRYSILVVAEGAKPKGGEVTVERIIADSPEPIRLGGIAHRVADELEKLTGRYCRAIVLGHLLRGGPPQGFDRILASRFGVAAVRAVVEGKFNRWSPTKRRHRARALSKQGREKIVLSIPILPSSCRLESAASTSAIGNRWFKFILNHYGSNFIDKPDAICHRCPP